MLSHAYSRARPMQHIAHCPAGNKPLIQNGYYDIARKYKEAEA
jgi:hypothetical protein